jgi:hypothetical protein
MVTDFMGTSFSVYAKAFFPSQDIATGKQHSSQPKFYLSQPFVAWRNFIECIVTTT